MVAPVLVSLIMASDLTRSEMSCIYKAWVHRKCSLTFQIKKYCTKSNIKGSTSYLYTKIRVWLEHDFFTKVRYQCSSGL